MSDETPMLLFLSDDGDTQPVGTDVNEASIHVPDEDAEVFNQFLDEARLHGTRGDGDELPKDTCHGTRGDGDEMPKDQDEATARDDDGFFDSVMATGTCHGTRGGGGHMTKHQATATARDDDGFFDSVMATGSLRERTKPKNDSIRTGTKQPLEGTFIIGDYDDGTDHKRQAAPRTTTSGPTRWRKGLVSRCAEARQQAFTREAEATARDS